MIVEQHLILKELILQPSAERLPIIEGWLVARVAEGLGYWLQHNLRASQLSVGDGFIATSNTQGKLRASRLDPLKLQFFTVQPRHLDGLLTVAEWHQTEAAHHQILSPILFFKGTSPIGQKFTRLASFSQTQRLQLRCALLQFWAMATADLLALHDFGADNGNKLRARFWQLFNQMTKRELCLSSPAELAQQVNCSERYFRGLFRKEFGVSLHAYQTELRHQNAFRLIADVNGKDDCQDCRNNHRFFPLPDPKKILGHLMDDDAGEVNQNSVESKTKRRGRNTFNL
jgi:AraC-like DNA-binding protein